MFDSRTDHGKNYLGTIAIYNKNVQIFTDQNRIDNETVAMSLISVRPIAHVLTENEDTETRRMKPRSSAQICIFDSLRLWF